MCLAFHREAAGHEDPWELQSGSLVASPAKYICAGEDFPPTAAVYGLRTAALGNSCKTWPVCPSLVKWDQCEKMQLHIPQLVLDSIKTMENNMAEVKCKSLRQALLLELIGGRRRFSPLLFVLVNKNISKIFLKKIVKYFNWVLNSWITGFMEFWPM